MKGSIKTIEELLLYALSQMDRARAILATQDKSAWLPELYTVDIYNRLEAIKTFKDTTFDKALKQVPQEVKDKVDADMKEIDSRFSSINKAEGDTPSSAHSYTEGSEINQATCEHSDPGNSGLCIKRGRSLYVAPKVKALFVPCNHCDESGCTFNCIGKRKNAVGPAVHPYPETLQSKLDDLSKAWKVFTNECKDFVFPSVPTMEQKVVAARELWLEFLDDKCVGNFETWLNKKK